MAAITTGFMVVNSYLPREEQLPVEALGKLPAEAVRRAFEVPATEGGQRPEDRTEGLAEASSVFADLFEQARTLSRKSVE